MDRSTGVAWAVTESPRSGCCYNMERLKRSNVDTGLGCLIGGGGLINPVLTLPSLKLAFSQLKMDGCNTIVSFWDLAYFQGRLLLVSGRVLLAPYPVALCHRRIRHKNYGHMATKLNQWGNPCVQGWW